jgi:hypothetical protein
LVNLGLAIYITAELTAMMIPPLVPSTGRKTEKPSGQFLSLIVMSHRLDEV